tara:strand:- start:859 stop:1512 length:654 start_codon:yes stop_codon:yes gene_type:complete
MSNIYANLDALDKPNFASWEKRKHQGVEYYANKDTGAVSKTDPRAKQGKKEKMVKLNSMISNEVSARAMTYGEEAEKHYGITDQEAEAYFFPPSAGGGKAKAKVKTWTARKTLEEKKRKFGMKAHAKVGAKKGQNTYDEKTSGLSKAQLVSGENRTIRAMSGHGKFVLRRNKIKKGKRIGQYDEFYFNPKTMVRHPAELGEPKSSDFGYEVGSSKYM